ncbi:MAG TPA: ATP-dependent DNA helicase RecQ [Ferruginibacter sp.]|nr:ATP-dependent DNA helicase RecQ [Ferruginibacter sp.]HMP20819.1 ATP-dependent DNA helicase RecQ [Ferruginibacter sp.]
MSIQQILHQYWGYSSFRPLQEDIITAVLEGNDTLALLPTGGGKSVCFQVPALANEGICLVVSPLIALMKDQVENLKKRGVPALAVYSGMSFIEVKKTLQNAAYGNYKFLYVSPERLETDLFLEFLPAMQINMIAVDEAHCISQWGYDFRPSYLKIAQLREHLPGVPVLALTASATPGVQADICAKLLFGNTKKIFRQSFERPNLSYSVFNVDSKQNKLLEILNNVNGSAIVYCKSRKHTRDVAEMLQMNKINAGFYHAGLTAGERNERQERWINNHTRVIACTNAFGMGIDKPDVRVVVHYDVPDCLENYYQEAGRAGRDGKRAYAVLLYNERELDELQQQSIVRYPDSHTIKNVYTALMNYLQVPAGGGEGCNYDFDLSSFATAFKTELLTANYCIKALEQQEVLLFNEAFYKPSTLVFQCTKEALDDFEKSYPEYEPVIKGLLRSYAGIFDFPAIISESKLARFVQLKTEQVAAMLHQLNKFGIAAYTPQKDKPQVTLLQNRMYMDSFILNLQSHLERKKSFEARLQEMLNYIHHPSQCRSQQIAGYFSDTTIQPCGICDNCINQKPVHISTEEYQKIRDYLMGVAQSGTVTIWQVMNGKSKISREKIWKILDYLQAEEKIVVNSQGIITTTA